MDAGREHDDMMMSSRIRVSMTIRTVMLSRTNNRKQILSRIDNQI